jgi:hypothetical protein
MSNLCTTVWIQSDSVEDGEAVTKSFSDGSQSLLHCAPSVLKEPRKRAPICSSGDVQKTQILVPHSAANSVTQTPRWETVDYLPGILWFWWGFFFFHFQHYFPCLFTREHRHSWWVYWSQGWNVCTGCRALDTFTPVNVRKTTDSVDRLRRN